MADGITYAGQPCVLDMAGQLQRYLEARWPRSRWPAERSRLDDPLRTHPFLGRGLAQGFASPYPDLPAPGINELIVPTGASRYGRALVVLGAEQIAAVASNVWGWTGTDLIGSLPSTWGTSQNAAALQFVSGGKIFSWQMHAVAPVLLDATGDRNLWLLPLVDVRYFWRRRPANVSVSSDSTWSDVFSALGTALGATVGLPSTPDAAHGSPDAESFSDTGASAAAVLDAAALSLGLRVVLASDGSATLQAAAAANPQHATNIALDGLQLGGDVPRNALPSAVKLVCRQAHDHYGGCGQSELVTAAIPGGSTSPSQLIVHSPWWSEYFGGVQDSGSASALTALAGRLASDWAAWGGKQYAASFAGVAPWVPTGHDDYLSVCAEESNGGTRLTTQAASLPPDFGPRVHLGQKTGVYVHPHDSAELTLSSSVSSGGTALSSLAAAPGATYAGSDVRSVQVTVEADPAPSEPIPAGKVVIGHYQCGTGWIARFDSPESSYSSGGRWIDFQASSVIDNTAEPPSCAAIVTREEGGAVSVLDSVTIHDPNQQFADMVPGCQGKAKWNHVFGRWEILNSTRPQNDLWVTLKTELKVTDSDAQVAQVWAVWSNPPFTVEVDMVDRWVDNPHRLEARTGADSLVRIQRRHGEQSTPWFIAEVTKRMPRVIFGVLYSAPTDDGTGTVTAEVDVLLEVDGSLPSGTTRVTATAQIKDGHIPPTHATLGWQGGDRVVLRYRPEDQKYYVLGTESSMLGGTRKRSVPVSVALNADHDIITKNRDLIVAGGWEDTETDVLAVDMALTYLMDGINANAATNSWDISRVKAWLPYTEPDAGYSIGGGSCEEAP